jgi:hypothetical protein
MPKSQQPQGSIPASSDTVAADEAVFYKPKKVIKKTLPVSIVMTKIMWTCQWSKHEGFTAKDIFGAFFI